MYVIIASLFIIIFLFFWQTIFKLIGSYSSNTKKPANSNSIGNMWFVSLVIINVLTCIFIYIFYYYKTTSPGKIGIDGTQGFPGDSGEPCYIKDTISCKLNEK